ncbi:hypothetical protein ACTG0T_12910 [Halococcus morrhuae DSM 1307]|uniref:hypothetical protein n=1 Tax=Halococcus morrhuae TaxID=2250 RepID=UPI0006777531|nr:hypothetical protein [Halococcus morrhuae]
MAEQSNTWVAFLVGGLAVVLVGAWLLDGLAWFIQYTFVAIGLLLIGYGYYRARLESFLD